MVVGLCHRILRRAGPLCRARGANEPAESLNRLAASPVVTPAAFGTKSGSNIAYLSRLGFLRTRLPLVWFQIAGSGAFYFAFPHPTACPRFDQYAPKTSRKGSAVSPMPASAPRLASGRLAG